MTEVNSEKETYPLVKVPGYSSFTLSSKKTTLYLKNPSENEVSFKYFLVDTDTNKVIYESNLIAPGKPYPLDVRKLLNVGIHHISINIDAYREINGEFVKRNSYNFPITVTVED